MSLRNWLGPLVASGVVGVVASACSSSNDAGAPGDAATDVIIHRMLESGALADDGGGDSGDLGSDGTTGKPCTSNKDCASPTGPGINKCSSAYTLPVGGSTVQLWPTAICIIPPTRANCDPAPLGKPLGPQYCDGPGPDVVSSPGLCVPIDPVNPQPGQGVCYPKCSFSLDGSKATGCAGSNTCNPSWLSAGTPVTGVGFCQGTCQSDADCQSLGTGYGCQTDTGFCTTTKVVRTKAVGDHCSVALDGGVDDNTTGVCNCASGMSSSGFCTSVCVVGGAPCPNGWICDANESATPFAGATVTKQNAGFPGICLAPCSQSDAGAPVADGGAVSDAGTGDAGDADAGPVATGACPPATTCKALTLAGPNCVP